MHCISPACSYRSFQIIYMLYKSAVLSPNCSLFQPEPPSIHSTQLFSAKKSTSNLTVISGFYLARQFELKMMWVKDLAEVYEFQKTFPLHNSLKPILVIRLNKSGMSHTPPIRTGPWLEKQVFMQISGWLVGHSHWSDCMERESCLNNHSSCCWLLTGQSVCSYDFMLSEHGCVFRVANWSRHIYCRISIHYPSSHQNVSR